MSITEIEKKYKTTDGEEFNNKEDAEKHQELIDAAAVYERARKRFNRLWLAQRKTADGFPVDLSVSNDFYYIQHTSGLPFLAELPYMGNQYNVDCQERIILCKKDAEGFRSYHIDSLYKKKSNAKIKLLEVSKLALDDMRQRIEGMEKDLTESGWKS